MKRIYYNGKIYTMDGKNSIVQAILVEGDRIKRTGSDESILLDTDRTVELIDLEGKTLVPGFNDSHMHLMMYGKSLNEVDLKGIKTIEDIIAKGRSFLEENPLEPGQWLTGAGWDQELFHNKRMIDRYDLDKISTDIPIMFSRMCHHVAACNTKAMEIAGITPATEIQGGEIEIKDGLVTGLIKENAVRYLRKYAGKLDRKGKRRNILKGMEALSALGITTVQTDDILSQDADEIVDIYKELEAERKMTLRVYQQCRFANPEALEGFIRSHKILDYEGPDYRIGSVKLLVDGTLGARTAAMNSPYSDDVTNYGILNHTEESLDSMVRAAHYNDMPVAIHAIGDKAIDMAINSIEKAQREIPKDYIRHGIVHCQITSRGALDRLSENRISAHIQPIFVASDSKIVEKRVGKDRARYTYNWKTLMDKGVLVTFGTDSPIESPDPLQNIHCAVNRTDMEGRPDGGWLPSEKLDVWESIRAYTLGSALGAGEGNVKGTIEPGKYADMALLSEDVFQINPLTIKDVECIMTIKGGEMVYKK